jgi:ATP-binding cassette subfamily B protein
MKKFVHYTQLHEKDCGPTCLKMIARHYGKTIPLAKISALAETTRSGSTLAGVADAAEHLGFRTLGIRIDFNTFRREAPLPAILHWQGHHYVVVHRITDAKVFVADPAHGLLSYSHADFLNRWVGLNATANTREGIALLLEPTAGFYQQPEEQDERHFGWQVLGTYLRRYRAYFGQLLVGLVAASLLQLIFPFLTQSIIDVGIKNQDLKLVYLILAAQLFMFFGRTALEIIRGWILLHLSSRINISLLSDFFIKLMKLPVSYFDTRLTGDIMQRINDHRRIEQLLTTSSLSTLFSLVNVVIFGTILLWYNVRIFAIFFVSTALYAAWILLFLRKRRELNYKRFSSISAEQSKVIETISGMQEIKLHNAERHKRWSWEYLQARLFRLEMRNLKLEQVQSVGSGFINELKNILITVFAATLVIQGQLTLGMMLAISYILGQLNGPIAQVVEFAHSLQDATIALERLTEIHNKAEEDPDPTAKIQRVDTEADLVLEQLSFRYVGSPAPVLRNLSFRIPAKKVTAIVGASGSGKSTLLKLLLKMYEPSAGSLSLGHTKLSTIGQQAWRAHFGVVMQEGYIFNDTIAANIALGHDDIDYPRLLQAVQVANIQDFIEGLPLSYNTRIGSEGMGISTGQKQRLLIARAVYKNPDFLFFDEATSALDARNERIIIENLQRYYLDKTVVVIAHRLSTVKHADQIVVMHQGEVAEIGDHHSLLAQQGAYYNLVKNQLELEKLDPHLAPDPYYAS